jgi:hypothetical protein
VTIRQFTLISRNAKHSINMDEAEMVVELGIKCEGGSLVKRFINCVLQFNSCPLLKCSGCTHQIKAALSGELYRSFLPTL